MKHRCVHCIRFSYSEINQVITNEALVLIAVRNSVLRNFRLFIADGFNDSSSYLTMGSKEFPELIIAKSDSVLSVYGDYVIDNTYLFDSTSEIYLYINPKTSIRGMGMLHFDAYLP